MFTKALKEMTWISENEDDNLENYLDALNYLDNMYPLIYRLQQYINVGDVQFLPSYKGKYIVERLGIPSTASENELKFFKIKSALFASDKNLTAQIKIACTDLCSCITQKDDVVIFILK